MSRERLVRLRIEHILETAEYLRVLTNDMTFEQFEANRTAVLATLHSLQTAGEAVRALPEDFRTQHPELPWREMTDMRNVIVHQYFRMGIISQTKRVGEKLKVSASARCR